jgi:arginyl-tRNA synthetase
MWSATRRRLAQAVRARILEAFGVEHDPVVEVPPRRELGDLAFPAALHLARELKRPPRAIATALLEGFVLPAGVARIDIAGAGYLNVYLDRGPFTAELLEPSAATATPDLGKVIVEHTNINPNKAAHIGHLRNAVLGDILARTLRFRGRQVEVQNYIDDTGVQLADVVVGFLDLRGLDPVAVAAIPEPFDHYCWDLYAEVGRWYEADPTRQQLRRATLHELESGSGPRADLGRAVARRVVANHLGTMARLGVGYDLLTRESEILRLSFFTQAFERLKASGAVHLEAEGKNKGCWVMPLSASETFAGLEDPDKVIVRSDGTVTYVGKDIAYQLWKFGLLGRDFEYTHWDQEGVWETVGPGASDHPPFGRGHNVVNVIDARQSYLQKIVKAGLESLGHADQAARSVHFAYEMVSLSAATARTLGFLGEHEEARSLEMSGRKGIGVKADDLLDQLVAKAREEIATRNRELDGPTLDTLAVQLATAAVRFFMVRWGTTRVIAFDLDEALSFEGDSGPYLQYSMVRVANIHRRLASAGQETSIDRSAVAGFGPAQLPDDLWDLVLASSMVDEVVEKAADSLELSLIARHALELAQRLNGLYSRHPILREEDPQLRLGRLAAFECFRKALANLAGILGIPVPERM